MLKEIHSKLAQSIDKPENPKIYGFQKSISCKNVKINIPTFPDNNITAFKTKIELSDVTHNLCLEMWETVNDTYIKISESDNLIDVDIFINEELLKTEKLTGKIDDIQFNHLTSTFSDNLVCIDSTIIELSTSFYIIPSNFQIDLSLFDEITHIHDLSDFIHIADVDISRNIFEPLLSSKSNGKNYSEKHEQKDLFGQPDDGDLSKTKVRKAYKREKTTRSEHIIQQSLWDLIYPILLPPLDYNFSEQFELYSDLYPFQKDGITFLYSRESALLADQMGTGKTVQSIITLRILFRKNIIKNCLIICPLAVLGSAHLSTITGKSEGWDGHLFNWAPELSVTVVRGSKEVKECDWSCPAHVYITTYDTLRGDIQNGLLKEEMFDSFDCIILDEAQYIKNRNAGRSRAIKKIKAKLRWALTGTPIENKIDDVISIFSYIKPGLFKTNLSYDPFEVRKTISPFFLRRLKKDVLHDLPDKIRQEEWLELDGNQKEAYNAVLLTGRSQLEEEVKTGSEFRIKRHIISLLQELKQICNFAPNCPTSPKTDKLLELIEIISENNEKVVIFSQYRKHGIDKLEEFLNRKRIKFVSLKGGQTDKERNRVIHDFRSDEDIHVFLASVKAAGTGITLTEASYVIHFDHWWNPAVMWQAEDRTHRPGQTKNVNVISFWMEDTIEEKIKLKLHEKGLLIENVIDSLATREIEKMISTQEWLEMFGVKTYSEKYRSKSATTIEDALDQIKKVSPDKFEELAKDFFIKYGYLNARVTQKSYDGGIDVFGTKVENGKTETIIAQCKRTENVGVKVARELLGVMADSGNVDRAFLITSGEFSSECINFANNNKKKLVLFNGLIFAKHLVNFNIL